MSENTEIVIDGVTPNNTNGGDCFPIAVSTALRMWDNAPGDQERESLRVVHAMVRGQGQLTGYRYAHAWVEVVGSIIGDIAIDNSHPELGVICPAAAYREAADVQMRVTEYTVSEVRAKLQEFKHYGPWPPNEYPQIERIEA